jgi:hypothetical protein
VTKLTVAGIVEKFQSVLTKGKKHPLVVLLIVLGGAVIYAAQVTDAAWRISRFLAEYSEKLQVGVRPGIILEPWFHLIIPFPPNPGQRPIPMWVAFYVTVHNTDSRSMWLSNYSVSAKTKRGWTELSQSRVPLGKDTLFCFFGLQQQALKPEWIFDYNVRGKPIAPDGYASGWMFSGSLMVDPITKLKFKFVDRNGIVHTREVKTVTASFSLTNKHDSTPPVAISAALDSFGFDLEPGPPLTPELEQYRKEMGVLTSLQRTGEFRQLEDRLDELQKQAR